MWVLLDEHIVLLWQGVVDVAHLGLSKAADSISPSILLENLCLLMAWMGVLCARSKPHVIETECTCSSEY